MTLLHEPPTPFALAPRADRSPAGSGSASPHPVIDIHTMDALPSDRRPSEWACPECGLVAGPFVAAEAAMLAAVHDRVIGHPIRTAAVLLLDGATTSDAEPQHAESRCGTAGSACRQRPRP